MHVTVRVRINWPVPAIKLLDTVTVAAGGHPETVRRDEAYPCDIFQMNRVSNEPDQGLMGGPTRLSRQHLCCW